MSITEYDITPVTKPRQTRSDKWKQRPCVMRYRAFADEVRAKGVSVKSGDSIVFVIPMPKSWSKQKKLIFNGTPHKQTPDLDNLCKAIFDAVYKDDCQIHKISLTKAWGEEGKIFVERK